MKHLYFLLSIAGFAILGVFLYSSYAQESVYTGSGSQGDPVTVCAAGCDFTTIHGAVQTVTSGSYIEVGLTYNSSTESWPVGFATTSLNLTCADPSVVIGPTTSLVSGRIGISEGSTISGCTFDATASPNDSGFTQTLNNTVFTSNTFRDYYVSLGTSSLFHNNSLTFTFASNTMLNIGGDNVTVSSNTLTYASTACTTECGDIFDIANFPEGGSQINGFTVASNTMTVGPNAVGSQFIESYTLGTDTQIRGNKIRYDGSGNTSSFFGVFQLYHRGDTATSSLLFQKNTVNVSNYTQDGPFFMIEDANSSTSTYGLNITSTLNVFYYDGTGSTSSMDIYAFNRNVTSSQFVEGYNGYSGQVGQSFSAVFAWGDEYASSVNESLFSTEPMIKVQDVDPTNNFELVPYSNLIDIVGTTDAGAVDMGVRGSSFAIDDTCIVDYSSCDATSTADIVANVRTGDTWNIAAGNYIPFELTTSTWATSSIYIVGTHPAVISPSFSDTSYAYGVSIVGLSDVQVSGVTVQDATTTVTSNYELTNAIFSFGGNDYDDDFGGGGDNSVVLYDVTTGCDADSYSNLYDGQEATIFDGSSDWNLVLAYSDLLGPSRAYATFWVPNNVAANRAAITGGPCGAFGVIIDKFVTSAFSNTDGTYTYQEAVVSAESITLKSGFDAPTLSRDITAAAGIRLTDTGSDVQLYNITSTGNYYGIDVTNASSSITISSTTIQNSLAYDLFASSSGAHLFVNVDFNPASTTIAGFASFESRYSTRVFVQATSTAPIAGVPVTIENSKGDSVFVTTTALGFTPYAEPIVAFLLQEGQVGADAGGYNPITFTAAATSTYSATSTSQNVTSSQDTITLTMDIGPGSPPTAPSDVAVNALTRTDSTLDVSWTDNSADETSFILDYITSSSTADFPGTTTSVPADITSTTIFIDTANSPVLIRVAANNGAGTSAYNTSSVVYTLAATPGKPSVTGITASTMTLEWSTSGNATGTVYELVNDTASSTVVTTTDLSYTATGLSASTTYEFKVRAQHISPVTSTWTDFSGLSTATSTLAVSEESEESESSGGGGGVFRIFEMKNSTSQFGNDSTEDSDDVTDDSCSLPAESAAKSTVSNAVYYITAACTKRPFNSSQKYFTYFTSWDNVTVTTQATLDNISDDTLGFMPWGPLYSPASGALVKTPTDPKTYLLLQGTLYHVASEAAAEYQFGENWASWIEDVDAGLLDNYPLSETKLDTTARPDGILIKYAGGPEVYQLDTVDGVQVKRWVPDEATFQSLNFRDDRIVTIPDSEEYPDGENISA